MSVEEQNKIIDEEFADASKEIIEKIQTQAMLLGGRAMCVTIARMMDAELNKPGKRTMADMKRIVKKVRDFCQKAVDHPVETPKFEAEN